MGTIEELEKKLIEIDEQLVPTVELGDRIPVDNILKDDKKYVLARRMVNGVWVIEVLPAEGVWEKIFNLLQQRKQILEELEKIAGEEAGYFSFVQEEELEIEETVTGTRPETKSEKMEEYVV